jgi:hypothetical protein
MTEAINIEFPILTRLLRSREALVKQGYQAGVK